MKKVEFFYYGMFLLSLILYNYFYVLANILPINFSPIVNYVISSVKYPFQFISSLFYILFIIDFLELKRKGGRVYLLCNYYKYYNFIFIIVFAILGILQIQSSDLFHVVTVILLMGSSIVLIMLWRINTMYSKVVFYGTLCTVTGLIIMHTLMIRRPDPNLFEAYTYLPSQIGELCDVFILGYSLSLKAADTDRKLLKSLQENQKLLETERSRLAKDLHDGLGGLLSGIKLTLGSIPGNAVLSGKSAVIFTKALGQLDITIEELRRVAHSMMPEALLRFGLSEAIQDYCDGINESNIVRMKFSQIGSHLQLEQSIQVIFYRIIQELTNNAIKHAGGKNIFVQLNKHEQGITLTIEDDGKGFDTQRMMKGAGLRNVQSRVDYLKGTMEINSIPGVGSSFNIEIPL